MKINLNEAFNRNLPEFKAENENKYIEVMKFTKEEEKKEVRRAFNTFLAQKGLKFKNFCTENKLDYNKEYQKLYRGNIDDSDVNRLVSMIDKNAKLKQMGESFVIYKGLGR